MNNSTLQRENYQNRWLMEKRVPEFEFYMIRWDNN
jgi:hypothetical protein